jgi:ADP-ribose pyrophosphatase YjhB (NUDIX family)
MQTTFRLAAYAVCLQDRRVLLARHVSGAWTLPGGRVEHGEDPLETVAREVLEETGCVAIVERLLGVDSRVIPAAERAKPGLPDHHNVGVFYAARLAGGDLRPEENGDILELAWTDLSQVAGLRRSSLVDVGLALAAGRPANGHVPAAPVGGLVQH